MWDKDKDCISNILKMSLLSGLKENLGPVVCSKFNRGYSHWIINVLLSSHCGVGQVIRMGDSSPSDLGSIPLGEKKGIKPIEARVGQFFQTLLASAKL